MECNYLFTRESKSRYATVVRNLASRHHPGISETLHTSGHKLLCNWEQTLTKAGLGFGERRGEERVI